MTVHDIFLSHSGHQKDFVEQLYVDLKGASLNVFFDKECLVEGEEFPKSLHKAASKCKIAVVVLSEDFFSASSWPMAETITSVQAKKPKFFPLFYLISPDVVRDPKKQEEWSAKWEGWRMERHNMDLQQYKETLKKIGITMGVEKNHLSEVEYRNKIVVRVKRTLKKINKKLVSDASISGGAISGGSSYGRSTSGHVSEDPIDRSGAPYAFDRPNLTPQFRPSSSLFDGDGHSGGSISEGAISGAALQPSYLARAGSALRQFGSYVGAGIGVGVGQVGGSALSEAVLGYFKPARENPSTDCPDVCKQVGPSECGPSDFGPSNDGPSNYGPSNSAQVGPSNILTGSRSSAGRSRRSSEDDLSYHVPTKHVPRNHGSRNHGPSNHGPSNHGPSDDSSSDDGASNYAQVGLSNILVGSRSSTGGSKRSRDDGPSNYAQVGLSNILVGSRSSTGGSRRSSDGGASHHGPSIYGPSNHGPSNYGSSYYGPSNSGPSKCAPVSLSNILTGSRSSVRPLQVRAMCGACARVRLRVLSNIPLTSPSMASPYYRCQVCGKVLHLIQDWCPRRMENSNSVLEVKNSNEVKTRY